MMRFPQPGTYAKPERLTFNVERVIGDLRTVKGVARRQSERGFYHPEKVAKAQALLVSGRSGNEVCALLRMGKATVGKVRKTVSLPPRQNAEPCVNAVPFDDSRADHMAFAELIWQRIKTPLEELMEKEEYEQREREDTIGFYAGRIAAANTGRVVYRSKEISAEPEQDFSPTVQPRPVTHFRPKHRRASMRGNFRSFELQP